MLTDAEIKAIQERVEMCRFAAEEARTSGMRDTWNGVAEALDCLLSENAELRAEVERLRRVEKATKEYKALLRRFVARAAQDIAFVCDNVPMGITCASICTRAFTAGDVRAARRALGLEAALAETQEEGK